MAALLAADAVAGLDHVLIDVLVAHGGLFILDAHLVQGLVQTEVGHDGGDYGVGGELSVLLEVLGLWVNRCCSNTTCDKYDFLFLKLINALFAEI